MKKTTAGFSIIIGMGLVVLISLSVYVLLSYMLPYSKTVKGIENSSKAYYNASSGVENALYFVKTRGNIISDTGASLPNTSTGIGFSTFSSGTSIPLSGEGNSEYDSGYNIISKTEPLQLQLGNSYLSSSSQWDNISFLFRVPDLDKNTLTPETLSGNTLPIINWLLSSETDTLIATGSFLKASDIKNSTVTTGVNLFSSASSFRLGSTILTPSDVNFQTFYNSNCSGASTCTLKMSIINPLELNNISATKVPYLEYKINFGANRVPDRYTKINSLGKSYGFQKKLEIKVPQQTVNQALDFTVFQ